MSHDLRRRLAGGFAALLFVIGAGTLGYYLLGGGLWRPGECLYMTAITLTTVGYGEVLPGFAEVEYARGFTIGLLVFGMGSFVYFASTLTAVIIEGDLSAALRKKRMNNRIARLKDHFVVCGLGSTGSRIMQELLATDRPAVGIDVSAERVEALTTTFDDDRFLYVVGDATEDEVLAAANLAHARGMVAALATDKDNLYLVVTARQAYPELRIVARGSGPRVLEKLTRAGADTVVSPNLIGGMRMVSELVRPQVVRFLDLMLRSDETPVRIEEVEVAPDSRLAGHTLADLRLRQAYGVTLMAAARAGAEEYDYNPTGEFAIQAGMTLVVLGATPKVVALRAAASGAKG
jgi:voltage-gated potassium channel